MTSISISKGSIHLAGLLYRPPGHAPKHAAVIVVHPGGGVKEQVASLYAAQLAKCGLITVCYDASHQGESGGEPRLLEDPSARVSDIWAVVDYLQAQAFVESERIGVLGICAGGGYAVAAAKADYRIKVVATVSMVNLGDSARHGWLGKDDPRKHVRSLKLVAGQMSAQCTVGAERATAKYFSSSPGADTAHDLKEAFDYYLTPRAQHPRAVNRMLVDSMPRIMSFDAFHLADLFLTQPILIVVGENAGSRWHSERLDDLIGGATRMVVVPNGTHVDFYDKPHFVKIAMQNISEFIIERFGV